MNDFASCLTVEPVIFLFESQPQLIDNYKSGYLGMARCFNVHRQLPFSKETVISKHKKNFG